MLRKRLIFAVLIGLSPAPVAMARGERTPWPPGLERFIPGDAWFLSHYVHDPKHDFLLDHWADVFNVARQSGVAESFKDLLASDMSAEEKAELNRFWSVAGSLLENLDWRDFVSREFAFAERLRGLLPDLIFLSRPPDQRREQNVAILVKVLEAVAKEHSDFKPMQSSAGGIQVWGIEADVPPTGLYVLQKGDVVGVIFGRAALDDVRSLLGGDKSAQSIAESPRYREALKHLPAPGFFVSFVDLDRLFDFLPRLPEMVFGDECPIESAATIKCLMAETIQQLAVFDYVIATSSAGDYRDETCEYTRLKVGAKSKPLYAMLKDRRPFADVLRYVPVTATGFQASPGIEPAALYDMVLNALATNVPDGKTYCDRWSQIQKANGIDVREDFLAWISGECITITLPPRFPSAYRTKDEVSLIRVKNGEKAPANLDAAIGKLRGLLDSWGQPLVVMPASGLPVEGFHSISHPMLAMSMTQPCIGVWGDWLVIGSSNEAVASVLNTTMGKAPNILDNPRFRAEGVIPKGPVRGASFMDLSRLSEEVAQVFFMLGVARAVMPPAQPNAKPVQAILDCASRLAPAASRINFYRSMSTTTVYRDNGWYMTGVTTYKRPAAAAGGP